MFTIILPKNRERHAALLERMFNKREGLLDDNGPDAFDTNETIYIVFENTQHQIFGSVRVNPLKKGILVKHGGMSRAMRSYQHLMEVSFVSFDVAGPLGHDLQGANFNFYTRLFYRGLYEALCTLAVEQDFAGYVTLNWPEEHDDCAYFGGWPFLKAFELEGPELATPLQGAFISCAAYTQNRAL